MARNKKFNVTPEDAQRIEAWLSKFREQLEEYKVLGQDFAGQAQDFAKKQYGDPAWQGLSYRIENNQKKRTRKAARQAKPPETKL